MQATEGIVLRTTPFEEHSFISTIFTKEFGIINVIKRVKKEQKGLSPLIKVELLVQPTHKELWKAKEMIVLTSYPNLRTSRETIMLAALILKSIRSIIPQQEPMQEFYARLDATLNKLALEKNKKMIAAQFFVRFLQEEGQLPEANMIKWSPLLTETEDYSEEKIASEVIEYIEHLLK